MYTLAGMCISAVTVENSMEFPQKIKNRITMQSSNFTAGYISKSTNSKRYMHPNVYNCQNMEANEMSINRWMDKDVAIYIMEYYSTIENNEILALAAT